MEPGGTHFVLARLLVATCPWREIGGLLAREAAQRGNTSGDGASPHSAKLGGLRGLRLLHPATSGSSVIVGVCLLGTEPTGVQRTAWIRLTLPLT